MYLFIQQNNSLYLIHIASKCYVFENEYQTRTIRHSHSCLFIRKVEFPDKAFRYKFILM